MAETLAALPGDDGDEEELVHFASARRNGQTCHREGRFGPIGRQGLRVEALRTAPDMIKDALEA